MTLEYVKIIEKDKQRGCNDKNGRRGFMTRKEHVIDMKRTKHVVIMTRTEHWLSYTRRYTLCHGKNRTRGCHDHRIEDVMDIEGFRGDIPCRGRG